MHTHKLIIRIPVQLADVPAGLFVNVFHRWIQDQSVADHLAIDVADYAHVDNGPGTLLVCSEANIHVDAAGLMYVRKRPFAEAATLEQSVELAVRAGLELADKLEHDPAAGSHFKRRRGELALRFNDRLLTPNTPDSARELIGPVTTAIGRVFSTPAEVAVVEGSPLELLTLLITVAGDRA